jgi:hypothetical protein
MYNWNNIKIRIDGNKEDYISGISKYLNAYHLLQENSRPDIHISVHDTDENMLPPLNKGSRKMNSITINLEREFELRIYSNGEKTWYFYNGVADYWLDQKENRAIISFHKKPFSFGYYNVLIFLLYPLGLLLENFGYYRIHSSCVDINGRSVLITGRSGSGKSTSAFALALNGGNMISDDLTFVKKTGGYYTTHTITRLVKLYDETIRRFYPELLQYDHVANDEGETYFDESLINNRTIKRSKLDSIVILEKIKKNESNITRIHPSQVISHLFPSSIQLNNRKSTHIKFDFLTDMLNNIPCYKVLFGTDMRDFYKKITGILGSSKE